MNMKVAELLRKNRHIRAFVHFWHVLGLELELYGKSMSSIRRGFRTDKPLIYYMGAPVHANLGDLAQGVCIREWMAAQFPEAHVVEIQNDAVVNTRFSVLPLLKKKMTERDLIVFQSGYTTTDLGGHADEMHRTVIEAFPSQKILMMPQTIFFKEERNRERTAKVYNSASNMLFLARDKVSFQMAQEMFPDIRTALFPDIVTTWIGRYDFSERSRDGVLFCLRDDLEKFYSDDDLEKMINKFKQAGRVERCDTSKQKKPREIVKNAKQAVLKEIEYYSHFKLVITDRYHGTIFSLAAGTPVLIIKSTDHKVVTGADWFKGIYDEYVFLADSPEDAFEKGSVILKCNVSHKPEPYFEKRYYAGLRKMWL